MENAARNMQRRFEDALQNCVDCVVAAVYFVTGSRRAQAQRPRRQCMAHSMQPSGRKLGTVDRGFVRVS
eukprot:scaffold465201_cov44-Prasinocladus_malaysianus.AAC.1